MDRLCWDYVKISDKVIRYICEKSCHSTEVISMSKVKVKYDDDFKKNAVRLSYAGPKSISDVAADLGINPDRLYA